MPLFVLYPKHLGAPEWKMSTRKTAVQIEARDEVHARTLAERCFAIPAVVEPELGAVFHPWWNPGLVEVKPVEAADRNVPLPGLLAFPLAQLASVGAMAEA